ncbi:hypothetical protein [Sphingorhabdus sp. EL138]|uniref:hypothetical protein n=1 Tax=Sphingorhabdus sp. EL138 TaxID=2073156 RepID=UPI0013A563A1|nr:hypothetical protein [Sphingorhabdus sp. EL138]
MASKITDAANAAEGNLDDPKNHLPSWLFVEDIDAQHLYIDGKPVYPNVLPIVVMLFQPEGALDIQRQTQQAERIDRDIRSVIGPVADQVQISCIMLDVPGDHCGGSGAIWRLPQIAAIAGFQHLTHLVKAA